MLNVYLSAIGLLQHSILTHGIRLIAVACILLPCLYTCILVEHGLGRPRILVADPGTDGFRTLQVPLGGGAADMDHVLDELSMSLYF